MGKGVLPCLKSESRGFLKNWLSGHWRRLALRRCCLPCCNGRCARPEVVTAHEQQTVQELQEYVAANHLRLDDLAEMNGWTPTRELVEITFVLEEQPLYHTCSEEHDGWSTMNAYPIQFADGTATVYITDLFEHRYTDYATAAATVRGSSPSGRTIVFAPALAFSHIFSIRFILPFASYFASVLTART